MLSLNVSKPESRIEMDFAKLRSKSFLKLTPALPPTSLFPPPHQPSLLTRYSHIKKIAKSKLIRREAEKLQSRKKEQKNLELSENINPFSFSGLLKKKKINKKIKVKHRRGVRKGLHFKNKFKPSYDRSIKLKSEWMFILR